MAYQGYLVKFGGSSGQIFPESMMYKDSYKARLEAQDLDSGRSASGVLHRNVLGHIPPSVSFSIKPSHEDGFEYAMKMLRDHYVTAPNSEGIYIERKLSLYFFCPEYDKYFTRTVYVATIDPTILQTYHKPNDLRYDVMTLEFIGY